MVADTPAAAARAGVLLAPAAAAAAAAAPAVAAACRASRGGAGCVRCSAGMPHHTRGAWCVAARLNGGRVCRRQLGILQPWPRCPTWTPAACFTGLLQGLRSPSPSPCCPAGEAPALPPGPGEAPGEEPGEGGPVCAAKAAPAGWQRASRVESTRLVCGSEATPACPVKCIQMPHHGGGGAAPRLRPPAAPSPPPSGSCPAAAACATDSRSCASCARICASSCCCPASCLRSAGWGQQQHAHTPGRAGAAAPTPPVHATRHKEGCSSTPQGQ